MEDVQKDKKVPFSVALWCRTCKLLFDEYVELPCSVDVSVLKNHSQLNQLIHRISSHMR